MYIILLKINTLYTASKLSANTSSVNVWFWLSMIEIVIILVLLFLVFKRQKKSLAFSDLNSDNLKKSKETNIDMSGLMNSINGAASLYKELSRKCHPDRFVNTANQKLAEEIFQEISKNKRDFDKLSKLKERAIKELDLIFENK